MFEKEIDKTCALIRLHCPFKVYQEIEKVCLTFLFRPEKDKFALFFVSFSYC